MRWGHQLAREVFASLPRTVRVVAPCVPQELGHAVYCTTLGRRTKGLASNETKATALYWTRNHLNTCVQLEDDAMFGIWYKSTHMDSNVALAC